MISKPIAPIELDTAKRLAADKLFGQKTADQLVIDPLPELKQVADVLPAGGIGAFTYQASGAETRGVATRMVTKPWVYVVSVPTASYTSVVGDSGLDLFAGIALVLALALAGAALLPRALGPGRPSPRGAPGGPATGPTKGPATPPRSTASTGSSSTSRSFRSRPRRTRPRSSCRRPRPVAPRPMPSSAPRRASTRSR